MEDEAREMPVAKRRSLGLLGLVNREFELNESELVIAIRKATFYSCLMQAMESGNWGRATKLVGDNIFSLDKVVNYSTPLLLAISSGRVDFVELLVSHGASVNFVNPAPLRWPSLPRVPLHCACQLGNVEMARFLLSMGADVNKMDAFNEAALAVAVRANKPELVSLLLTNGATIDHVNPFHAANRHLGTKGWRRIVTILVRHGVPVNSRCFSDAITPLHLAAFAGDEDTVRMLTECGANCSSGTWSSLVPYNAKRNPAFYAWCKALLDRPSSLKCLSGQVVRMHLVKTHKRSILELLTKLDLPKTVVEYLTLERFAYMEK